VNDVAIVILTGGRATRFPGKLERPIAGEPVLQRVYANAKATGLPVFISGSATLSPPLAGRLGAPVIEDRWPGGGPLRALVTACESLEHARIFALAGDEPSVDATLIASIVAAWQPDDEAVVGRHSGRVEPLAALYARAAVLRVAPALLARSQASMRALIERIQTRILPVSDSCFANVNAPNDLLRAAGGTAH
jgi:molybdopterin-guanine dinucleotide biosynthesis protein A